MCAISKVCCWLFFIICRFYSIFILYSSSVIFNSLYCQTIIIYNMPIAHCTFITIPLCIRIKWKVLPDSEWHNGVEASYSGKMWFATFGKRNEKEWKMNEERVREIAVIFSEMARLEKPIKNESVFSLSLSRIYQWEIVTSWNMMCIQWATCTHIS